MSVQSRVFPLSERILHIELVYEPIFSTLSPANLVRISSTCRTAYAAAAAYTRLTFDINASSRATFPRRPAQEYARPRAFRSLQARTGTLVSGSTALQFFKRTVWPESDLDLYVHMRHRREVAQWLLDEGYQNPNGIYSMPGVMAIPDRTSNSVDGEEEADDDACVMNVISYEKAYCLFPQATLEQRRTLLSSSCRGKGKHRMDGLAKYQLRGFQVLYDLPHHEVLPDPATPLLPSFRRDRISRAESYLYPSQPSAFDLTRAATSSVQTRTNQRFVSDGAGLTTLRHGSSRSLSRAAHARPCVGVQLGGALPPAGRGSMMHFEVATGKILRYRYLVTDEQLLAHLAKELSARVRIGAKARLELEEWTYYDEELPAS
ncbi:hypothetical protein C8T65DRAFT_690547, partial [Cerioporus squamosus]